MLTPTEYVNYYLLKYPSLYSASTREKVHFKVFDQLFNTIGNGIWDDEELVEALKLEPVDPVLAEKFITSETLYYGYYEVDTLSERIAVGKGDWIFVLESEKEQHSDIVKWVKCPMPATFVPYPNFDDKYSLVYRTNFKDLDPKWHSAAIWYYTKCLEYFNSEKSSTYHYAFPKTFDNPIDEYRNSNEQILSGWKTALDRYDSNESISEAYEQEYNGNLEEFVTTRWNNEKARIIKFINDTIEMLQDLKNEQ